MRPIHTRAALGLGIVLATSATAAAQPSSIHLNGVVRDFKASAEAGGHLDFETLQQFQEGVGPKIYCIDLVAPTLGPDGMPRLNGRWHSEDSGVPEQLLDVDFATPNTGFAVGAAGRVLRTGNGGATWVPQVLPGGFASRLWAVDFTSVLRGFVAGVTGRVFQTSDGGATWVTDGPALGGTVYDIQFPLNDLDGYAIASGGRAFHRGGGGWVLRTTFMNGATPLDIRYVHFPVGISRGYAVGRGGAIVLTANGFNGPLGVGYSLPAVNPALGVVDLHDVHFLSNAVGYAVGSSGWIIKTVNGGVNWARVGAGVTTEDLCGVHVVNATTVFAVGVAGTTLISRDSGATWTDAVSDATVSLNAVHFPYATVGYAVGDDGAIERFGAGQLITAPWTDAAGRPISPLLYDQLLGDLPGTYGNPYFERIHTEAGFAQWWTDTPGVNLSTVVDLEFVRQADGTYLFDSATQDPWMTRGGFFPIDGQLFGDYQATAHNFHFTFHMQATFTYDDSIGQMLEFIGDDDVWVFFDGRMAVDVGGRHPPRGQFVDLNRLGLLDGQQYTMDFFSAERQTLGSNIRISTNIEFEGVAPPTISGGFD
jgi:fibro-slime domain-containing protein